MVMRGELLGIGGGKELLSKLYETFLNENYTQLAGKFVTLESDCNSFVCCHLLKKCIRT